jgi:protein involved in polysaccharide export with SLBB domain
MKGWRYYKSKVNVGALMEQGLSGPELGEAIVARFRQQINNPVVEDVV